MWSFIVLGAAALFEGISFIVSLRLFMQRLKGRPFWQALHSSKDPSNYTVLAEDGAALCGVVIAAMGIGLSVATGTPLYDALASVLIGVLLAAVAVALIRESRGLLIGEGLRHSRFRA
jgi:divalent metal cation (Fe/Co/Zn/Cd) transporter